MKQIKQKHFDLLNMQLQQKKQDIDDKLEMKRLTKVNIDKDVNHPLY
jgi:hypothetical protein